ncbi:MAG: hypothetical protein WAT53_01485, partial [Nitrosomonas sp.]
MAIAIDALPPGISISEARDFIFANVDQPGIIFNKAAEFGITTEMLSEITGYSSAVISGYLASFGLDTKLLDEVKILINSDPGDLSYLIDFNDHTGVLSTASLRDQVKALLKNPGDYDSFFEPVFFYQNKDNVYTPDELGVSHLGNVPANSESLESIFFGTLINITNSLDAIELKRIIDFPPLDLNNLNDFIAIVADALSDPAATPYSDEFLVDFTVQNAVDEIEEYWAGDSSLVGIL